MTAPSHPGLSQLHSKAEALLVAVQYYNLNIEFSGKAKFVPRNQNYRKERSGTHWKHCRMRREEAEGQTKYMSEVCALPRRVTGDTSVSYQQKCSWGSPLAILGMGGDALFLGTFWLLGKAPSFLGTG